MLVLHLLLAKKRLVALRHLKLLVRSDTGFRVTLEVVEVLQERVHREILCLALMHTERILEALFQISLTLATNFILKLWIVLHYVPIVLPHLLEPFFRVR